MSTGQGLLGCNTFAYCLNNPICFADPYGLCTYTAYQPWISPNGRYDDCGSVSCPTSSAYRYYANASQHTDSYSGRLGADLGTLFNDWVFALEFFEEWSGTFAVGVTAGCMGGLGGTISIAIVFDSDGNLGMLITPAVGAGIYACGISGFANVTDAKGIEELRGLSKQFGGAILAGGYEHAWFNGAETSTPYQGSSVIVGPVGPAPAEIHFTLGYSFVIPLVNVRR